MMTVTTKTKIYRMKIDLDLRFATAFHIGSGMEGEAGSDNGVLVDELNRPIVPGSSLKGILRSTIEKLLGMMRLDSLWTCGLQNGLYGDKKCIGGGLKDETYKNANKQYQDSDGVKTDLITQNCCSVCSLFGSPLTAGRIYLEDARLKNPDDFVLTKRDGVGIDRDSGTAVPNVKYGYDVANSGLCYAVVIESEQVDDDDSAILGLGLLEWLHAGVRIGGKTSRGLGHAVVEDIAIHTVDIGDAEQRKAYILRGEMHTIGDPKQFLQDRVNRIIQ